jgi:O-antigen/teichoic acid export membrane protein
LVLSDIFKKYFWNTSWLFFERIFRMCIALFVGVYVARYLGPDQYGLLNYSISFVALFSTIATLGLNDIVIRELVKDENKRDKLLGTTFWLKIFGALLAIGILGIAVNFTSNSTETNLMIFIIAIGTLFQSLDVIDYYFQAKVQSRFVVHAKFWALVGVSAAKILLISLNVSLIWFVSLILIEYIATAIGFLLNYTRQKLSILRWKFDKSMAFHLLENSWPLIFTGFIISIYMRIDQVMIKEMLDYQAVGYYSVAVNLSEAWYFIPTVIVSSLFPAIIEAKSVSEDLYYKRLQKLFDLMVLLAVGIAIPTTFLSDWVIVSLYGDEFQSAGAVLSIHIWAGLFVFLGVARGTWILTENLQRYSFIYTLLGAISNVILNFFMIPVYGIAGAAYATLISQFVSVVVVPFLIQKTRSSVYMMGKSIFFISSVKNILTLLKGYYGQDNWFYNRKP